MSASVRFVTIMLLMVLIGAVIWRREARQEAALTEEDTEQKIQGVDNDYPSPSSDSKQQEGTIDNREALRQKQIDNYKVGTGLSLNLHVTHHAGTFLCTDFARPNGPTPDFACMSGDNWPTDEVSNAYPWDRSEFERNVGLIRRHFHFISWEFGHQRWLRTELDQCCNWEDERIVSMLVMRHPLDRLLAYDGYASKKYGSPESRTPEQWWSHANDPKHSNNFALRVLSRSRECCQGKDTDRKHLDIAKALLDRMTFVMDMQCLNDNLEEAARLLNMTFAPHAGAKKHPPVRERMGNDTLYEYYLERNKLDMELYAYAQKKSLVQCVKDESTSAKPPEH